MEDRQLWDATVTYYRERLEQSSSAQRYLARRGLGSPELLDHFEVGYCDRTLARHMPPRRSREGQRFRSRLMDLGIMRRGSGQEHMSGRVVVPVRDESELVVGMYGRTIHSKLHTEVTRSTSISRVRSVGF